MSGARQSLWIFLLLMSIAGSGWYFARPAEKFRLDQQTLAVTADMMVHELSVKQFNEQGQLVNHLTTPYLEHIPSNDTYTLSQPEIRVLQQDQSHWVIHSNKAIAVNRGEKITFQDHVVIDQLAEAKHPASQFRTDSISYFPKLQKAITQEYIVFEQPGTIVESIGMEAWLAEKKVNLLKRARGRYVPTHS